MNTQNHTQEQETKPQRIHQQGDETSRFAFICFRTEDVTPIMKAGAGRVIQLDSVDSATLQELANDESIEASVLLYSEEDEGRSEEVNTYFHGAHKVFQRIKVAGGIAQMTATQPDGLKNIVGVSLDYMEVSTRPEKEILLERYQNETTGAKVVDFLQGITSGADTSFIPTGHKDLDKALNGGLYPCFYVVGGISSIGKTAFTMQIADQVAAAGNDVLIFSLEMSEGELMARSISRHTFERVKGTPDQNRAKTEQQITTRAFWDKYDEKELDLIQQAARDYQVYATDHIHIFEGVGNISAADIKQKILEHIDLTGNKPLVIIDYLQIIAPEDIRATDKQNTDKNVLEIKRLTRDLCLPIVAISSFNRESYAEPVTMASFKESGAIEYSSDCLIGVQYNGMDYDPNGSKNGGPENKKEHIARVRTLLDEQNNRGKAGQAQDIQAKVLKNRKGYKENCIKFAYYPRYSYFENPAAPDRDGFKPCANAGANRITEKHTAS